MRRLIACLLLVSLAQAQGGLTISLSDGSQLRGKLLGLVERDGRNLLLLLEPGAEQESSILADRVLGFHGSPPIRTGRVEVYLVGGDQILGELRGGDEDGESFFLQSASLGSLSIPIDRLAVMLFRERVGARGPGDFLIPESVEEDEALFFPAKVRGFDRRFGAIHGFAPNKIRFEESGAEPHDFEFRYLSAISLRGGEAAPQPATAWLLTRSGDLLGAELLGIEAGRLRFLIEGGRTVALHPEQLSALSFRSPAWIYLSDLPLLGVHENSYFDEAGEALRPHRLDRSATGEFLAVQGQSYIKGIGVHSRSVLRWKVPAGARFFHARVGLDDSVLELPVRGEVSLRVLLDDEVLYANEALASGQDPVDLGQLPVRPGSVLSLEVDFGKGFDLGDRVDWLDAVFLLEG